MKLYGILSRAFVMLIVLAILPRIYAQQSGTPAAGSQSTTAPQIPQRAPVPMTPVPSDNRNTRPQLNQDFMFITGTVVLENGTPPPFGSVIERECGGSVVKETAVDPLGHFSYQIGDPNRAGRIFPDASQAIGQDPIERDLTRSSNTENPRSFAEMIADMLPTSLYAKLAGCVVRAQFPGYRSTSVPIGGGMSTAVFDVGTIVLYPITRVQGTTVSATNLLAPKAAKQALENAKKASKKREFSEARKCIDAAIEIYPEYAEAWFDLGQLDQQQQRHPEARRAYKQAIAADKLFLNPYIGLAQISAKEEKWTDVVDLTDKALALDPLSIPEAHFLNALAYYNQNKLDLAEKSALRGQRMDYSNRIPKINLVLANILAKRNDAAGAVEAMKKYLKAAPKASDAQLVRVRIRETEKIAKSMPGNPKP